MKNEELLSKLESYKDLMTLLYVSKSQACRLYNGVHQLSECQRELLSIKLGLGDEYTPTTENV